MWQYRSAFTGEVVLTESFIRDSVDQVGNIFIWYKEPSWVEPNVYKIDTLNNVYELHSPNDTTNVPLLYSLSADSGVGWTFLSTEAESIFARVVGVFPATVFGHQVTMKKLEYTRYPPGGGFWLGNRYLATGFGLVRWEIEPSDVYVLSGAMIDGDLYGTIVGIDSPGLPSLREFSLKQNFPNPFNPSTTIQYSIPQPSFVTLKIYNLLGQEIATLVEGDMSPGQHSITWNAEGKPSGVYFCRLSCANTTVTIRLLLLR